MNDQPAPSPSAGGQWVRGNQNVQVHGLAEGASVHVTFAGQTRRVPLRAAVVPPGRKVRSPARLMRASSGVLPFVDRDDLLDGLKAWMADPRSFSTYLIGGHGGSGKTRLGVQMCLLAQEEGWVCGLLEDHAEQGGVEALAEVPTARLVVVDYAETRAEKFAALLPALKAGASVEHPVRVLLLVRAGLLDGEWSAALGWHGDFLEAVLEDTDEQILDQRPLTVDERTQLFTRTADAFAQLEQPNPAADTPPPSAPALEGPAFATPLMVVAAAYLSVHGGQYLPTTSQGLLTELAAHEDHYWLLTATEQDLGLDKTMRARVVATATLAGAGGEDEARDLLVLLPDLADASAERRGRLARWAHDLYPGPRWWNPLEPDLLGEHLVATHLTEYPQVLAGALQRDDPAAVTQPLGLYARAAADHPDLATAMAPVLTTALPDLCRAAVAQAAAYTDLTSLLGTTTIATALERAVSTIPLATAGLPDALPEALNALPRRSNLILGQLALTMTAQVVSMRRRMVGDDPNALASALAASLTNLSVRLTHVGQREGALDAGREAVDVRRHLAQMDRATHEPRLALALNNLCNRLAEAGHREEALRTSWEAVNTYRYLTADEAAAHKPGLALALNNLSNRLAETGHREEALRISKEAVHIYQCLDADEPAAHKPDLALALNSLSRHLAEAGQDEDAVSVSRKAVDIYRGLTDDAPATHGPNLVMALNNLSDRLARTGHGPEAAIIKGEADTLERHLAQPGLSPPQVLMSR